MLFTEVKQSSSSNKDSKDKESTLVSTIMASSFSRLNLREPATVDRSQKKQHNKSFCKMKSCDESSTLDLVNNETGTTITDSSFTSEKNEDSLINSNVASSTFSANKNKAISHPMICKTVSFGSNKTYEIENFQNKNEGNNKNYYYNNYHRLKNKMWYSPLELEKIQNKNHFLIEKATLKGILYVEKNNSRKYKNQTIRGLEQMLPNDILSKKRYYLQQKSRYSVIHEQSRQKKLGITDPTLIKTMYEENGGKKCQAFANKFGQYDQEIAIEIQKQKTNDNNNDKKNTLFSKLITSPKMK